MKSFVFALLALLVVFSAPLAAQTTAGKVVFCQGIDDKWKPINPASSFDTNVVSILFQSAESKPFGVIDGLISIYHKPTSDGAQEILHREPIMLNAEWNNLYIADIPLPAIGVYTFVLSKTDGTLLSSGDVTIQEKTVDKPIPEKNEVKGTDLKALFDFYSNKSTK
jgi:hypothetical protein